MKAKQPFLVFYRAMIGAGKTTVALALAHSMLGGARVIYCCTVNSVRKQFSQMAYNSKIKFALGALGEIHYAHKVRKDKYKRLYKDVNDEIDRLAEAIPDELKRGEWLR